MQDEDEGIAITINSALVQGDMYAWNQLLNTTEEWKGDLRRRGELKEVVEVLDGGGVGEKREVESTSAWDELCESRFSPCSCSMVKCQEGRIVSLVLEGIMFTPCHSLASYYASFSGEQFSSSFKRPIPSSIGLLSGLTALTIKGH